MCDLIINNNQYNRYNNATQIQELFKSGLFLITRGQLAVKVFV